MAILSKVVNTAKKIAEDQKKRLTNAANVLAASVGLKKGTVVAKTPSKAVNKVLETVQKHPFTAAGIATGAGGLVKAAPTIAKATLPTATAAAKSILPAAGAAAKAAAPTIGKMAAGTGATVAIVGMTAPELLTKENLGRILSYGIDPKKTIVAEGLSILNKAQKSAKEGFSSLPPAGKGAVILGGSALIAGAGYTGMKILQGMKVLETPGIATDYAKDLAQNASKQLVKTPSDQVPKVINAGQQDPTTPSESGISPFKENAVEVVAKPVTRRKKRKIYKPKPSSQSVKQNVINQVYVGG